MRLISRFVPWWVVVVLVLLNVTYVVATAAFLVPVPYWLPAAATAALFAVAGAVASGPGRAHLSRAVAPAEVFTVELDEGSRSRVDPSLTESWFYLVVQADGLAFWSLAREPQPAALVVWDALRNTTVELTGPVVIEPVGDGGIYLQVKRRPAELLRRRFLSAGRLSALVAEHVSSAQPDSAHTPPRAQTGS